MLTWAMADILHIFNYGTSFFIELQIIDHIWLKCRGSDDWTMLTWTMADILQILKDAASLILELQII